MHERQVRTARSTAPDDGRNIMPTKEYVALDSVLDPEDQSIFDAIRKSDSVVTMRLCDLTQ